MRWPAPLPASHPHLICQDLLLLNSQRHLESDHFHCLPVYAPSMLLPGLLLPPVSPAVCAQDSSHDPSGHEPHRAAAARRTHMRQPPQQAPPRAAVPFLSPSVPLSLSFTSFKSLLKCDLIPSLNPVLLIVLLSMYHQSLSCPCLLYTVCLLPTQ